MADNGILESLRSVVGNGISFYRNKKESETVGSTWEGFRNKGKVGYSLVDAAGELVNNFLTKTKKVKGQIVIDTITGDMWTSDNMSGVRDHTQMNEALFMAGASLKTDAILSEHHMGMISSLCWWGIHQSTKSCSDSEGRTYICKADFDKSIASYFPAEKSDKIQMFNTQSGKWEEHNGVGLQHYVKLYKNNIPKNNSKFTNLTKGLGAKYWYHLGETNKLELEIIKLQNGILVDSWKVKPHKPLLADPHSLHNGSSIDKARMMGLNQWTIDGEIFEYGDRIVKVYAGYAPYDKNVEAHYDDTKDEVYNPKIYSENPFRFNGELRGLSYSKERVTIGKAAFKASSRDEKVVGFIEIVKGIDTTVTKDDIVRPADMDNFEQALEKWLKGKGLKMRTLNKYNAFDEKTMEKNFVNKFNKSTALRKALGFTKGAKASNKGLLGSGKAGIPDACLMVLPNDLIDTIVELKKEGSDRLYKAIVQGFSYAIQNDTNKFMIIAQDQALPDQVQNKIDVMISGLRDTDGNSFTFDYYQYQFLMNFKED